MITSLQRFAMKVRDSLKKEFPSAFRAYKKFVALPFIFPIYRKIYGYLFPATERYDPFQPNAETDYFNAYAKVIEDQAHGRVLDLGCGFGYLTERVANKVNVSEVIAIDKIPPEDFRFSFHPKITYFQQDLTKNPEALPPFDVIIASEFIEHLREEDFRRLLLWIKRELKPDGLFLGSTPYNKSAGIKFSNSPFHIREYQPEALKAILIQSGFQNVQLSLFDDFFVWRARI